VIDRVDEVSVAVHGGDNRRVTQPFLDGLDRHTGGDQQRDVGVA